MHEYTFTVKVTTDTAEHALQALNERLGHEEDYGFDYSLFWTWATRSPEENQGA